MVGEMKNQSMKTQKSSITKTFEKMHRQSNRIAWKKMNEKRKAMGLVLIPYNPNRKYWI
jgi:hypothetical protein